MNTWFLIVIFVFSLVMGFLDVPFGITLPIIICLCIVFVLLRNPLSFSRDPHKMMEFLRNAKHPHLNFVYFLMNEQFAEAEERLHEVKSRRYKSLGQVMLLTKKQEYEKASVILVKMPNNKVKKYYQAIIDLHLKDKEAYQNAKKQFTDRTHKVWLEAEEHRINGDLEEAVNLIDRQLSKLRGINYLSAFYFKKELEDEKNKYKELK